MKNKMDSKDDHATYISFETKCDTYATEVLKHLKCNQNMRKRIREDVIDALNVRSEELGIYDPILLMGTPQEVAAEFSVNLGLPGVSGWEYKSDTVIFGVPLIHIVSNRMKFAKGIIAVGPISIGVVSLGGVSVGLLSIGGVSLGMLALGGLAIAYDIAVGGLSIAYHMAIGGLAIANDIAIGGQSIAQIAGHMQNPNIASESIKFVYRLSNESNQMFDRIQQMFPNIGIIKQWIIELLLQ